jgi:hypothetical protein
MNVDKIKSEILKESPDWLLISSLAKEIYESGLESNALNFKKGVLNVIKCSEYETHDVYKEIKACFDGDEYHYITTDDVRWFNKWIKSKPDLFSQYYIIITAKPQMVTNPLSEGIDCNLYKVGVRFKYDRAKATKFTIKSDTINLSFEKEGLKQEIRNIALTKLLS